MGEKIRMFVKVAGEHRLFSGPTLSKGGSYIVEGEFQHTHYEMTHIGSNCYRWEAFTKVGAREFFSLLEKSIFTEGHLIFPNDGGACEQAAV